MATVGVKGLMQTNRIHSLTIHLTWCRSFWWGFFTKHRQPS